MGCWAISWSKRSCNYSIKGWHQIFGEVLFSCLSEKYPTTHIKTPPNRLVCCFAFFSKRTKGERKHGVHTLRDNDQDHHTTCMPGHHSAEFLRKMGTHTLHNLEKVTSEVIGNADPSFFFFLHFKAIFVCSSLGTANLPTCSREMDGNKGELCTSIWVEFFSCLLPQTLMRK